jgi:hypothetical protein
VLGHEAAKQGLFENNNIKNKTRNTHAHFQVGHTRERRVAEQRVLAASEVACAEVRKSQRRGVRGDCALIMRTSTLPLK